MSLRAALLTTLLGLAVLPIQARAQHVVTDAEASKLTFDSLVAVPRPVYRPIAAFRRVHRAGYVNRAMHASTNAVYRRRIGVHFSRR